MRLYQFLHQLCAVMEAVDEGLVFIGRADPAKSMQVAKFTKYADAFSVIWIV